MIYQQVKLQTYLTSYIKELKQSLDDLDLIQVEKIVRTLLMAYKRRRTIFIIGNGGSASTASHMACDLGKGTLKRVYDQLEPRFRVISLTDNVATMTAFGNDLTYEDIFVQQLRNLISKNDILLALSVSGNSPNIVKAVLYAREKGARTIGLLGFQTGGKLAHLVDQAIIIKSSHYGPCEDLALVLNHLFTTALAQAKHAHDRKHMNINSRSL